MNRINHKRIYTVKDVCIGILLAGLLIVGQPVKSEGATAVLLFITAAVTATVILYGLDALFIRWMTKEKPLSKVSD